MSRLTFDRNIQKLDRRQRYLYIGLYVLGFGKNESKEIVSQVQEN